MAQEQQTPLAVLDRRVSPPVFTRFYRGMGTFAERKPIGSIGAVIMLLMIFAAGTAQWISPYDPLEVHPRDRLAGVFETKEASGNLYILGSDEIGRDILSRTIYGAPTSVTIAFLAILLGTTTGTIIGMASAYFGGYFDVLVQRVRDAMFPCLC